MEKPLEQAQGPSRPADQTAETVQDAPSASPPGTGGQANALGAPGESSDIVLLWKQQVKAMVENLWKAPQGIILPGTSIEATYALRISGDGELLNVSLTTPSGSVPFDRSI